MSSFVINVLLFPLIILCVITDIKEGKIYNKVLFPAIILGFIIHTAMAGWDGLWHSFLGFLLGLALLLLPYLLGGMGAGDVKFLAAIGALKGPAFVFQTFIFMAFLGAVLAIGIILYRRGLRQVWTGLMSGIGMTRSERKTTFPYGIAIAGGAFISLFTKGVLFL